ncbi:MAG: cell division protein FtsZ [Flavobacteriales bacterium]|jgi:cell division protein FtsZ|tara:strand:- start:13909 stop:15633 length:1725 start_codon:yes stop_codon:yes gene_type:complete
MTNDSILKFNLPKNQSSVIKVIGVGGGGSNAVNYMFEQGIVGVDFAVCNTDLQALEASPITTKIQIGEDLTEGLGAGANPEVGRKAAEESIERITELLESNTKMLFITAGMGGGTGTGAAPVIARIAREKEILTVGVVTVPFWTEGGFRKEYAEKGLEDLRQNVDTLLVINNDKLIEVYGDLTLRQAFAKANEVLNTATKGIAEVISQTLMVNIDLNDAKRVLKDSGSAVMGQAIASGENRAVEAVEAALDSPLLHDNNIKGAQQVLLKIVTGTENEIRMTELFKIKKHIQDAAGGDVNIIEGVGVEDGLGESISVTVIATGFKVSKTIGPKESESKKVYVLEKDEPVVQEIVKEEEVENNDTLSKDNDEEVQATLAFDVDESPTFDFDLSSQSVDPIVDFSNDQIEAVSEPMAPQIEPTIEQMTEPIANLEAEDELIIHSLDLEEDTIPEFGLLPQEEERHQEVITQPEEVISEIKEEELKDELTQINHGVTAEQMAIRSRQRMDRLRNISMKLRTPSGLTDLENQPAYKRREVQLDNISHSSESDVSKYTLGKDSDDNPVIKPNNFLHDNVD